MKRSQHTPALGRHRSAGFTLVEVIVAMAIMVTIAATVTQGVVAYLDRTRVENGRSTLTTLDAAITSFRTNVTQYPRSLSHLSTPIVGTDQNSCGTAYGTTNAARWAGPYISRIVPATGMRVFVGKAQNNLIRTVSGSVVTLTIRVDSVRLEDAQALETQVDTDGTSTAGTIRWGAATNGLVTLDYVRASSGC